MKRATVIFLVLSMCSIPLFAQGDQISKARCMSLEHVRGAWVMKIECAEGSGSITSWDEGSYKGSGIFAKWSQDKLRSTYQALLPHDDNQTDIPQLG